MSDKIPWWAKGVRFPEREWTDDEIELAFDMAWGRGCLWVYESNTGHLEIVRDEPGQPRDRKRGIYALKSDVAFRALADDGWLELDENLADTHGKYGGMWVATRKLERYAYFLYREGGARPWELYRKNVRTRE